MHKSEGPTAAQHEEQLVKQLLDTAVTGPAADVYATVQQAKADAPRRFKKLHEGVRRHLGGSKVNFFSFSPLLAQLVAGRVSPGLGDQVRATAIFSSVISVSTK
jgi:hypothetical protein